MTKRKKPDTSGMRPFVVTYRGSFVHCGVNWSEAAMLAFVCLLWNNKRHNQITNPKPLDSFSSSLEPRLLSCRASSDEEVKLFRAEYGKSAYSSALVFEPELSEPPDFEPVPIEVYEQFIPSSRFIRI